MENENANVGQKETTERIIFTPEQQEVFDREIKNAYTKAYSKAKEEHIDYEELKEIEAELEGFGYTGTTAEKKAAIKAQREQYAKQQELESLQDEAKENGTSPELLSEIKQLKSELAELKGEREAIKKAETDKKAADTAFNKQVNEFGEQYPDVDLAKVGENPKFLKFVKGRAGTLVELYGDFVDFVGETEQELETLRKTVEAKEANQKNAETSTGSVKGEKPTGDFISYEAFEKNKADQSWIKKNFSKIVESRAKW